MQKRRGKIKKTIRNTILTLSCITFLVVTGIFAVEIYQEQVSSANMKKVQAMAAVSVSESKAAMDAINESPEEQNTNLVSLKIEYLYKKNKDLTGWLRVNGSEIDYPIMYRDGDNDYYLQHDFFGDFVGTGFDHHDSILSAGDS